MSTHKSVSFELLAMTEKYLLIVATEFIVIIDKKMEERKVWIRSSLKQQKLYRTYKCIEA